MGKTGFEKAFGKMFPDNMGPEVKIVQPDGSPRMTRDERRALEKGVVQPSVSAVIRPAAPASPDVVPAGEPTTFFEEPRKQGRGRPRRESTEGEMALMNFRVSKVFRTRIKKFAVDHGISITDLFEMAMTRYLDSTE